KIPIFKITTSGGNKELEMEEERLQDEFVILKTAIVDAINKAQESVDDLNGIDRYGMVFSKDVALTCMNVGSGVVGWVDDF
ncbi:MAG: hypothetical protein KAQ82_02005, partial [Dehalococcoidia bacterium]|nr:hypothetical protein [Dehalococcoidia bacterium]